MDNTKAEIQNLVDNLNNYFNKVDDISDVINLSKLDAHNFLFKLYIQQLYKLLGVTATNDIIDYCKSVKPISFDNFYDYWFKLNYDSKPKVDNSKENVTPKEDETPKKKCENKNFEESYFVNGKKVSKNEFYKVFKSRDFYDNFFNFNF